MNALIVGFDKSEVLKHLPDHFLFIDDGPLIDQLDLPKRRAVTHFDTTVHSFNPLKDMSYRRAREFIAVLDAVFPEGENTLTRRYSNFVLLNALLTGKQRLGSLLPEPTKKDTPGAIDAYQKVQTLLLSPVLEPVLNRPTNMSFKGTIVARLNRAELGDFDCFVLGNLLISLYPGPVVVPDFGFYACRSHVGLIRQNRLIAGVTSFDETPALRRYLLAIENKVPSRTTPDDAKVLAVFRGLLPGTNDYNDFIAHCVQSS